MTAWHLLAAGHLGLTLLGPCLRGRCPHASPSPVVSSVLKGCLAEQLLFTRPFTEDLSEPSHLPLCVTEEVLLQAFSHLLLFL